MDCATQDALWRCRLQNEQLLEESKVQAQREAAAAEEARARAARETEEAEAAEEVEAALMAEYARAKASGNLRAVGRLVAQLGPRADRALALGPHAVRQRGHRPSSSIVWKRAHFA